MTWPRRAAWPTRSSSCTGGVSARNGRPASSSTDQRRPRPPPSSPGHFTGEPRRLLMLRRLFLQCCAAALLATLIAHPLAAGERYIVVGSTTSTEDSGLFGWLLP